MSAKVLVVDYGRGNLLSLMRALSFIGAEPAVSSDPAEIAAADRVILPGVGAFGDGMEGLHSRGFVEPIRRYCASGKPLLGICLGMQLLLEESEEFGLHAGLGVVPGRVVRLNEPAADSPRHKIPHIGWNAISPAAPHSSWKGTPFDGLPWETFVYFVHSFVAAPDNPRHRMAETEYAGQTFCSALASGNVYGCQFHPEKSGEAGLLILKNWLSLVPNPAEVS